MGDKNSCWEFCTNCLGIVFCVGFHVLLTWNTLKVCVPGIPHPLTHHPVEFRPKGYYAGRLTRQNTLMVWMRNVPPSSRNNWTQLNTWSPSRRTGFEIRNLTPLPVCSLCFPQRSALTPELSVSHASTFACFRVSDQDGLFLFGTISQDKLSSCCLWPWLIFITSIKRSNW